MDNKTSPKLDNNNLVSSEAIDPSQKVHNQHQARKGSHIVVLTLLAFVLMVISGASAYAYRGQLVNKQQSELTSLHGQVNDLQKDTYDLPASAIKVSDCIPSMGSHYLVANGDKEYGPFYLVAKNKKVIGIEYMAASSMYTKIPDSPIPLEILTKNSPTFGLKIDHTEFSHLSKGHEGFEKDHIDVHLYTVKPEQVKAACN